MITPSGMTIREYNDAIALENPIHARVTFVKENVVFEDAEFDYNNGISVSSYMNPDTSMKFGTAFCKEIVVNFIRSDKTDGLNWSSEFKFELGVQDGNNVKWVTIGYFTGERPTWTRRDVIELIAYDRMMRFEKRANDYLTNVSYPCTLQDIYDGLCSFVVLDNVEGDEISSVMAYEYSSAITVEKDMTCRDLLMEIAKANGCYARITNDGKVKLTWFKDCTNDYTLTWDDCFDIDVSDLQLKDRWQWYMLEETQWQDLENTTYSYYDNNYGTKIGIRSLSFLWNDDENPILITQPASGTVSSWANVKGSTNTWLTIKANTWGWYRNDSELDGNTYTIEDNPFLYHDTETVIRNHLQSILDKIYSFNLRYIANVNAVGNWLVETGDVIMLQVDEGVFTRYPIFNQVLVWNGACTSEYETTGSMNREDIYL